MNTKRANTKFRTICLSTLAMSILTPPASASASVVSAIGMQSACATLAFEAPLPITGLAFASPKDTATPKDTSPSGELNQEAIPATLIFSAHGDKGAIAHDLEGHEVWRYNGRADTVSAFGNTILVYTKIEKKPDLDKSGLNEDGSGEAGLQKPEYQGSELRTYKLNANGEINYVNTQSPSEIAPTTLQRSSYAAFGSVRLTRTGVQTNDGLIPLAVEPTAFAATNKTSHPSLTKGAVAIALNNGLIEVWSKTAAKLRCASHPSRPIKR